MTYTRLSEFIEAGATIKATKLMAEFDYAAFQKANPSGVPMVLIKEKAHVEMATADHPLAAKAGQTLAWLAM